MPVPFEEWLAAVRAEALAKGISQRTVDAALGSVERLPVVVERDRTQAEVTLRWISTSRGVSRRAPCAPRARWPRRTALNSSARPPDSACPAR